MLREGLQGARTDASIARHLFIVRPFGAFQAVEHILQVLVDHRQLLRLGCDPSLLGRNQERIVPWRLGSSGAAEALQLTS